MSPKPKTIVFITSTIEEATTTRLTPNDDKPIDKAKMPAPTKAHPAPNISIDMLKDFIVGIKGAKIRAETPNITNTPAMANRLLTKPPQDSLPIDLITPPRMAKETAASNNDPEASIFIY